MAPTTITTITVLYGLGALFATVHFALVVATMTVPFDGLQYDTPLAAKYLDPVNAEMKAEFDGEKNLECG